jgi:hypothetical protein
MFMVGWREAAAVVRVAVSRIRSDGIVLTPILTVIRVALTRIRSDGIVLTPISTVPARGWASGECTGAEGTQDVVSHPLPICSFASIMAG